MGTKILFMVILIMVSAVLSKENPYCLLKSCPNGSHTLCKFSDSTLGSSCSRLTRIGLTPYEKDELLRLHNTIRRDPYLDRSKRAKKFYATPLEWDNELAKSARRWALQCRDVTDDCRNDVRFNVTQRVGVYDDYITEDAEPTVFTPVFEWYHQDALNHKNLTGSGSTGTSENHSNRIAREPWGKATRFGCDVVRTADIRKNYLHIVCNYGPSDENKE